MPETTTTYKLQKLSDIPDVQFVSSGVKEIDEMTGGFPRGRITEIYGVQSAGKTEVTLRCLAEASQHGKVLYVDAENALNPIRFREKGGKESNITVTDTNVLEEAAEITIENVGKYDVIVVDSIAQLVPGPEKAGSTGDQFIGVKARLMGQWIRKIVALLGKSNTALIFINQLRESPSLYAPKVTPGGKAVPYAASLRLELSVKKADRIIKNKEVIGQKVKVEVTKSKICKPHQSTTFRVDF